MNFDISSYPVDDAPQMPVVGAPSLVRTDAVSFHPVKSAEYGSLYEKLRSTFQTITQMEIRPQARAKKEDMLKLAKTLSQPTLTAAQQAFDKGKLDLVTTTGTGSEIKEPLTPKALNTVWSTFPRLSSALGCKTPAEFIETFAEAYLKVKDAKRENRKAHDKISTNLTREVVEPDVEYKVKWKLADIDYKSPFVTELDREFTYAHIRKNCGVLYWVADDYTGAIPIKEAKEGAISTSDTDFWRSWVRHSDPLFKSYFDTALNTMNELIYHLEVGPDGYPTESVDDKLLRILPQFVLHGLAIGFETKTSVEDGKKTQSFNRVYLCTRRTARTTQSNTIRDWKEEASDKFLGELCCEDAIKPIKQFSNIEGEGLTVVDLSHIDTSPTRCVSQRPELPPTWNRFLWGSNGNFSIFQSDPYMSLLRLAYFVVQVVHDNGLLSRQILCASGNGGDGKSVLGKLLCDLVGTGSTSIKADTIDDDKTNYAVLNKTLILLSECKRPSSVIRSPFVKSVTGGDTVQLRKLFCMPIEWTPEHAHFMMTTNAAIQVANDNEISRLLPLAMRQNYTPDDQESLAWFRVHCDEERDAFIQWAFDTVTYYRDLRNVKGETMSIWMKNGMKVISDVQFDQWMKGELDLGPTANWSQICKFAIEHTGDDRYRVLLSEDSSEEECGLLNYLADTLFEVTGNAEDKVFTRDLLLELNKLAEGKSHVAGAIKQVDLSGSKVYTRTSYKNFLKLLGEIEGIKKSRDGHNGQYFMGLKFKKDESASLESDTF